MKPRSATAEFLADRVNRACMPATLEAYGKQLRWFNDFLDALGVTDVESLSASDVTAYVASLQCDDRHLSAVTVHRRMATLRVYLHWLIDTERIKPAVLRLVPWPRKPHRVPKAITIEQATRLLSASMPVRDRAIVALLLDTGIRESECCSLDVDDLDLEGGTVLVRKGKGAKQRVVIFEAETKRLLLEWLDVRTSSGSALFVALHSNKTSRVGERLSDNGLYTAVKRAADSVGLGKAVSPHRLRHSFASMYLDNGGTLEDASELLGHSDISITMQYVHISREKLKRNHRNASPMNRLKRGY